MNVVNYIVLLAFYTTELRWPSEPITTTVGLFFTRLVSYTATVLSVSAVWDKPLSYLAVFWFVLVIEMGIYIYQFEADFSE